MKSAALWTLLILMFLDLQNGPAAQKGQLPFSITTRLDRTALWVGDSLEYTIQVIHPRSVQFALDHLKKENFALPPFVLRSVRTEEREWRENQKLLEIVLLLTTYESGKTELLIPPVALYYFRRDSAISEKEAPAQTVRVPGQRIALRSTLVGGQPRLRDFKPTQPVDLSFAIGALVLGLIGMGTVGSYAVGRLWHALHRDKAVKKPVSRRVRERWIQERLQQIRTMAQDSPGDRERYCAAVSQFIRQYLTEWLDVEAEGLTPLETEQALEAAGCDGGFAHQLRTVLEHCEEVLYRDSDGRTTGEERHPASLLDSLEQAIKLSPRTR